MGVSADTGPLVTFGQGQSLDYNANAGPNAWYQGDMLLDPRGIYTYQPGEDSAAASINGWMSTTALPLIDQVPSALANNNIAASQAPTTNVALTLVSSTGAGITVGCAITNAATGLAVTGLLGIDVNTATAPQPVVNFGAGGTGSGGPMACWNPLWSVSRCVIVTTNGNDSSGFYTVNGYDIYGFPMSQKLTGPNNTTGTTTKAFKYISSVVPSGTIASTLVSVGTTDTYGFPLRTDRVPYVSIWWGTPQQLATGGGIGGQTVFDFPINALTTLANAQVFQVVVPFDGTIISMSYNANVATTTASKAATATLQANGVSVTGGVLTITSNTDTSPAGHTKTSTAVTAGGAFTAGQTVGFVISNVTAFVEGSGTFSVVVQNTDVTGGTFTGAVTTNPATQTTGDVRGTFTTPSASDGTKRLTVFWTPVVANMPTTVGLVGVTQV